MNDRKKSVYAYLLFIAFLMLLIGCRTTGGAALTALSEQQTDTAIIAERITEGSASITADLKVIEANSGSLEPAVRAVRIKAEALEVDAGALKDSLETEREITGTVRAEVAEKDKKIERMTGQRNLIIGVLAVLILGIAAIQAVKFFSK